ncbi:MAG: hypothetical protein AAGJ37_00090 [Pseudomonadota bacterium]
MAYTTLILVVIFGVYWGNVNDRLNTSNQCALLKNECFFSTQKGEFRLKFEQTPIAEEELKIAFNIPDGLTVHHAHIQGINMYMGRIPVLFEDGLPENTAVTFLGSCNLVEMQWVLTIEYDVDGIRDSVQVFFSTYQ